MSDSYPAVDIHIAVIAIIAAIGFSLLLSVGFSLIAAVVFCQFPLMTRAFSSEFKGWNYVVTNEAIIGTVALGISVLIG